MVFSGVACLVSVLVELRLSCGGYVFVGYVQMCEFRVGLAYVGVCLWWVGSLLVLFGLMYNVLVWLVSVCLCLVFWYLLVWVVCGGCGICGCLIWVVCGGCL